MNAQFVVTMMGPDRPGMMKELAAETHQRGGKWLRSKVSRLEGQFTAIIQIEIASDQVASLKEQFGALRDYQVAFPGAGAKPPEHRRKIELTVDASDRPGLVNDISHLLVESGILIEDMSCHRVGVVGLGSMFTASFDLGVPDSVDVDEIERALEDMEPGAKIHLKSGPV